MIDLTKHHCDLAVLKCIDFRFRQADQEFISQQFGVSDFDLIAWPGAARAVVHDEVMREKIITTLKNVCCGLHAIKKLVILNHWDCGGYGGSKAFSAPEAEASAYETDLRQARELLQTHLSEVEIMLAYSHHLDSGIEYKVIR